MCVCVVGVCVWWVCIQPSKHVHVYSVFARAEKEKKACNTTAIQSYSIIINQQDSDKELFSAHSICLVR